MFGIYFCENKNINNALNYFIIQSDENTNNVLELLKYNNNLIDVLDKLNLSKVDFTDSDWYNLLNFCKKNDILY